MAFRGCLVSYALDKLRTDSESYFGAVPLDIIRLIDAYLADGKPVAVAEVGRWRCDGVFVGCYDDIILLRHKDKYSVRGIFGERLCGELCGSDATLLGRDEIFISFVDQECIINTHIVNFRTGVSYEPESVYAPLTHVNTAVRVYHGIYKDGILYRHQGNWSKNDTSGKAHKLPDTVRRPRIVPPIEILRSDYGWTIKRYGVIQCEPSHCAEYAGGAFYCSGSFLLYIDECGVKTLMSGMTGWRVVACYDNYLLLWYGSTSEFHVYLIQV